MPADAFVHLHTHSEYSLLDGAARIKDLVRRAREHGQPAVAITDHGVLASAIEFYEAATAEGITPIMGCEVYVAARAHNQREGKADRDPSHLILLARDRQGYANLVKLVSRAHLEGFYYKPRIDREMLAEHAAGLVALSGCIGGEVPQRLLAGDPAGAEALARQYQEIMGPDNYFLEIQDHGMEEERVVREGLMRISAATGIPLVATNDCHYVDPGDAEAHDVLLCIQTGSRLEDPKRLRFAGPHFYLSSTEEMVAKFDYCPEAVTNSGHIAARCRFEPELGQKLLPRYELPPGEEPDQLLAKVAAEGLRFRCHGDPSPEYLERLDYELGVIRETGFTAYFLIVWDFIKAGREQGVTIGPGRGSAAGSLVAYSLGITNVDPVRYGLIFERFLNPERVSMPDIDTDFDVAGRGRVIEYVTRKYGADRVAQIVTYGTMAARAALRDVGRVLSVPLSDVDRLAKLVPARVGMTIDLALKETSELRELYESEEWVKRLVDIARRLEGICRNAGTHAAGVVIAPGPLTDYVPLQRATANRDAVVTQLDWKGVEKIGLLKMDFLGLENLTILQEALANIEKARGVRPDLDALPFDDRATYELLARGDTLGVFQMEQQGGRRIVIDMRPNSLEDMAAAVALNRPGVIEGGATELYMKRRRGEEPVSYLLPELEPVLRETMGVIVYQDQVMQIAVAAAGFSLGAADLLRAAMGKKDKVKMAAQREAFLAGAIARGVSPEKAEELFDYIDFFAGYGFGKAHAIAYGVISYHTAYLKANYPLEYMTALLNSKAGDFDRLKLAIQDTQARGIVVHPPDVNRSQPQFSVHLSPGAKVKGGGEILFGLQHVKNVGEGAARALVAAREEDGPFQSLEELCLRLKGRDLNRRALEALIRCGACDQLGDRGRLLAELDGALRSAERLARDRDSGQISLFEMEVTMEVTATVTTPTEGRRAPGFLPAVVPLSEEGQRERLAWERELLGIYLSEHPLQRVAGELALRTDAKVAELSQLEGKLVQVGGALRECRRVQNRKGASMAFARLEDLSGVCEVVIFPSVFERGSQLLQADAVVVVRGRVEVGPRPGSGPAVTPAIPALAEEGESEPGPVEETEEARIIAEEVFSLTDPALLDWKAPAVLRLRLGAVSEPILEKIGGLLQANPGETPVRLLVRDAEGEHELDLGPDFRVEPSRALEEGVVSLCGGGCYQLSLIRSAAAKPQRPKVWAS